jgi:hypothetical protein
MGGKGNNNLHCNSRFNPCSSLKRPGMEAIPEAAVNSNASGCAPMRI